MKSQICLLNSFFGSLTSVSLLMHWFTSWTANQRDLFFRLPTDSTCRIGGQSAKEIPLIGCSASESVHEKRNGSEGPKQTIKKEHTDGYSFSFSSQLDARVYFCSSSLGVSCSLSSGCCLFWMTNTHYRRLLVRRVIATHACAVSYVLLGRRLKSLRCVPVRLLAKTQRREATQQSCSVGTCSLVCRPLNMATVIELELGGMNPSLMVSHAEHTAHTVTYVLCFQPILAPGV